MTKNDNELRDFFAANAMNALMEKYRINYIPYSKADFARCSYEMADEMMKTRKEKKQDDQG
jgi:hypothetical protein